MVGVVSYIQLHLPVVSGAGRDLHHGEGVGGVVAGVHGGSGRGLRYYMLLKLFEGRSCFIDVRDVKNGAVNWFLLQIWGRGWAELRAWLPGCEWTCLSSKSWATFKL